MRESEWGLGSFRARNNHSHLLRLLDDVEKFVNIDVADRIQQLKAETAPDHRGGCQHPHLILVEPLQTAADDQPHVFWYVELGDLDSRAELACLIKDLPLFDQMPVHLLDEEWISLALLEDETQKTFRSLALA